MTFEDSPEFSVVVPTWNRKDLLARALRSLVNQTYRDFEVVVVDDGSKDDTGTFVQQFRDLRIRLLSQEHLGVSKARNCGAADARGRYLTFLDSDDEATTGWLEAMAAAFATERTAAVCSGVRVLYRRRSEILLPRDLGRVYCGFTGLYLAGSYAVRAETFHALRGFVEDLAFAENTEFGLRLTAWCREHDRQIASIAKDLLIYHRDGPRRAMTEGELRKRYEAATYIVKVHGDRYRGVNSHALGNYCAIAGVNAARLGLRTEARRWLFQAIRIDPWRALHYGRLVAFLAGRWTARSGAAGGGNRMRLRGGFPD